MKSTRLGTERALLAPYGIRKEGERGRERERERRERNISKKDLESQKISN